MPIQYLLFEIEATLEPVVAVVKGGALLFAGGLLLLSGGLLLVLAALRLVDSLSNAIRAATVRTPHWFAARVWTAGHHPWMPSRWSRRPHVAVVRKWSR